VASLSDMVEEHMAPPLPSVGAGEPVEEAVGELENADAVVVHEDGDPVGVLTRQDLLGYVATL
ncbi:CBS domain-containing protein, partial [Mumia sp.]